MSSRTYVFQSFDSLKLKLSNAMSLHWQKTLAKTLDYIVITKVYIRCLQYHQSTWYGKFGWDLTSTFPECLDKLFNSGVATMDIPNLRRIMVQVEQVVADAKPNKRVTRDTLEQLDGFHKRWERLRDQVKDAICAWAEGLEGMFGEMAAGKNSAVHNNPMWLLLIVSAALSIVVTRRYSNI